MRRGHSRERCVRQDALAAAQRQLQVLQQRVEQLERRATAAPAAAAPATKKASKAKDAKVASQLRVVVQRCNGASLLVVSMKRTRN